MSRKGRARRSKIPMSIRSGDANPLAPRPRDSRPSVGTPRPGEMVEATSAPQAVVATQGIVPRPEAPALNFEPPSNVPRPPSSRAGAAETSEPDFARDDISVPPVGLDGAFFDEHVSAESSLEIEARDARVALKLTPMAARRRAHLAKYVTLAVGLASALCAAALIKNTVARGHESERSHPAAAAQLLANSTPPPALNTVATTEPTPSPPAIANSAPADTATAAADTPAAAATAAAAPAPERAAQPVDPPVAVQGAPAAPAEGSQSAAAPAETAAPAEPAEVPSDPKEAAKEAAKEKVKSRGALEWGKMGDAITAGERAVALDPTDAEAWLILGAAYQQKGDSKNAVRSFRACMDEGKRGPKNECAAMLR
jgi:Flp pilus assembly protein TadD